MKYDKYIISFAPGSSGRFVRNVLNAMILQITDPMELTDLNSAHNLNPYTGISVIDPNVNDIYENLSDREILKLVDLLVDEGVVISTNTSKNESMSFLDEEWKETLLKLMDNRRRLSNEDEENKIKMEQNLNDSEMFNKFHEFSLKIE